jgi:colanic acid/amylovoran biosynthesis glycosyltransferase
MMQKRVAHFVRKLLPPAVSFIRNQVMSHITYTPHIIYKESIDSPLAREIRSAHECLFLEEHKERLTLKISEFLYDRFRRITPQDVHSILTFLHARGISVLHFHYGTDAGMYLDVIKSSPVPKLVSFYGYDCSSFPRSYLGFGRYYLSHVFRNIDYVLAMSEDMRDDLVGLGCPEAKVIVHYYGTDVRNFKHDREYRERGHVTLLIVSSLDEKKGHRYILDALQQLEPSLQARIRLRIVGSGPLEGELKRFVNSNGLRDIVTFVGPRKYLSHEFLQEFYDADIFIHPSVTAPNGDKEGIPGAIIEAMATGLPVIATYHAGIPHVVRHQETGLLVAEKDVGALSECIRRLVLDAGVRKTIGLKAQDDAQNRLDLEDKEIELEDIYDFVIENHKIP